MVGGRVLIDCIGGGNGSNNEGERLEEGKFLGGVHDSRLCDSDHILATCVSSVLEAGGMLWRDGLHWRFVCFDGLSEMTFFLPASWIGVGGLRGGLLGSGRGCVLHVSVDVLGLLVREILCWGGSPRFGVQRF